MNEEEPGECTGFFLYGLIILIAQGLIFYLSGPFTIYFGTDQAVSLK